MPFPDSTTKAPNVFLDTVDVTGSPSPAAPVISKQISIVINVAPQFPGTPTDIVASLI